MHVITSLVANMISLMSVAIASFFLSSPACKIATVPTIGLASNHVQLENQEQSSAGGKFPILPRVDCISLTLYSTTILIKG